MQKSDIITREQAVEIMIRPLKYPEGFLERLIDSCAEMSDTKFIKEFRKSTDLKLIKFYDKKYQIVWST